MAHDAVLELERLVALARLHVVRPAVDTDTFHPDRRDPDVERVSGARVRGRVRRHHVQARGVGPEAADQLVGIEGDPDRFGVPGVFTFIAGCMAIVTLSIGLLGPRTSGLALETISK